ncbi:MAG: murein hydrolase activator EnvC family protein, partial [Actinomycetota bacterium]
LLIVALAAPVGADSTSTRRQRDEARRRRAAAAAQLDAMQVSDAQLEAALAALEANVQGQQSQVQAAQVAAKAAEDEVAATQIKIDATRQRIGDLHDDLEQRAVEAYMRPADDALGGVLGSRDINEAGRKQALLSQVAASQLDVIDELAAAEEDLVVLKAEVEAAAERARAARDEAQERLAELEQARAEKARVAADLDARIAEIRAEADALAAQDAELTALIRRKEAEAAQTAQSAGSSGRVSTSGLVWPARGPVTSEYGQRWGRLHAGIDIGAGTGAPIWAAQSGTVIFSGVQSGYGQVIIIDHGGGLSTLYAHQSRRIATDGQRVSRGQTIGLVGSTGQSTGPHLHFETRENGSPVNPRRYLP